jgi:CarboxypepD_reg-like domain
MKHIFCLVFLSLFIGKIKAQSNLKKTVTVNIKEQSLKDALVIIGNEGDFNFSYNAKVINKDSIVSIYASQKPVGELLRMLFNSNYEFKESGNYVIIRKKAIISTNTIDQTITGNPYFIINGIVVDDETGFIIPNATIYEKQNLISTITDENGAFSFKLKNKYNTAQISISKDSYSDTSVEVRAKFNQRLVIAMSKIPLLISKRDDTLMQDIIVESVIEFQDSIVPKSTHILFEDDWLVRSMMNTQARINQINLRKFITNRKFQLSLLPFMSTHGRMNAQVINSLSINILGGYSAGTNGLEAGGLFNVNKGNARYLQAAGIYNTVGGNFKGLQAAGLFNKVNGNFNGLQAAGLSNIVKSNFSGVQVSCLVSSVKKDGQGLQVAGIFNNVFNRWKGVQVGLINRVGLIKGLQIGLINVAKSNSGFSLGLINISKGKRNKNRIGFLLRVPRKNNISK